MTKMEMMEKLYGRSEELEKKFDAAEKVGDAQTMQACRDAYQELVKEVQAEGEDFGNMMRLYSDMKKHGNSLLDVSGSYTEPERIIQMFKEFGVKEFTFSSNWTNAKDTAWVFTKMGCNLKGMVEIYSDNKKLMNNEYEKRPTFLFTL